MWASALGVGVGISVERVRAKARMSWTKSRASTSNRRARASNGWWQVTYIDKEALRESRGGTDGMRVRTREDEDRCEDEGGDSDT